MSKSRENGYVAAWHNGLHILINQESTLTSSFDQESKRTKSLIHRPVYYGAFHVIISFLFPFINFYYSQNIRKLDDKIRKRDLKKRERLVNDFDGPACCDLTGDRVCRYVGLTSVCGWVPSMLYLITYIEETHINIFHFDEFSIVCFFL